MTEAGPADAFSGVRDVEPRHRFDEAALHRWIEQSVEGYAGPLRVLQFKGGQSNPTYRLETPGRAYVLRRKPFGPLLPSAHAVEREYRVMAALNTVGFAAPRAYALCEDVAVIGAAFFVMEAVEGSIHWNGALPGLEPCGRRKVYEAMIATLAELHRVEPEAVGLGDYGRPGNYFARQVDRWSRQYRASETGRIEAAERLLAWLPRSVPEQAGSCIVHGDYRLDNLILAPAGDRVAAVLDWELSTLGDPLADICGLLMNWETPPDGRSGLKGLDLAELGIPTRDEAAALYCRLSGRDAIPALDWYMAYALFRMAAILQGIGGRVRDGTASSPQAAEMAARAPALAEAAWTFALRAGA